MCQIYLAPSKKWVFAGRQAHAIDLPVPASMVIARRLARMPVRQHAFSFFGADGQFD